MQRMRRIRSMRIGMQEASQSKSLYQNADSTITGGLVVIYSYYIILHFPSYPLVSVGLINPEMHQINHHTYINPAAC